jgi:hypothetical protein
MLQWRACCEEVIVTGPEIVELRGEIRLLHNGTRRLSSMVKIEEPHREAPEVSKRESEEKR